MSYCLVIYTLCECHFGFFVELRLWLSCSDCFIKFTYMHRGYAVVMYVLLFVSCIGDSSFIALQLLRLD